MKKQVDSCIFSKKDVAQAWKFIQNASHITLLTHHNPDGDGIGACLAFEHILTRLGKTTETIYPNRPEFEYKRQPVNLLIGKHNILPDLVICCDTANFDRLYYPDLFKGIPLINIDHHVSNSIGGTVNFVDPESPSVCEAVFSLLQEWDVSLINKDVAEALLFGILYDSQVFHIQSTRSDTLRIAAELVDKGANMFTLKQELLSHKNPRIIKVWGLLLQRVEISLEKKTAWTYITQEDLKEQGVTLSCLIGFNNFLAQISDIDVTLFFYETDEGKTKVSLRSKEYDVNTLAQQFGGGGHSCAAGILSDISLKELIGKVVGKI